VVCKFGERISLSGDILARAWGKAMGNDWNQLTMFFERMMDGIAYHKIIVDKKGKPVDYIFLEVNNAFEELTGLKRENIIGRKVTEVLKGIENDPADWIGVYGRVALTCEPLKFENFAEPLDKWFKISAYCPEKGYFIALFEDITERKKTEETLRNTNEELEERVQKRTEEVSSERQRLYSILETIPAYVVLLDKDYRMPFANKVFRERFGDSEGKRCHEYLFNLNSPCENCETYKAMKTNEPLHWEWTGPDRRDYEIYDFPFVEADGSTLILEMGIDITDRKLAEKQLRTASLYARSLIEASIDPLVTINVNGKITDVNKATEEITGCARNQLIGSDFSDYFTEPTKARKGYMKTFTEGFVRDYPLVIRQKSGKITHVLYNATVYKDENGEVQGVFAAARDITELMKAEEIGKENAKKLKDAEQLAAIGATAGMVGHDIRNPLQAITSDVYLAKTDLVSVPDSNEKQNVQESLIEIERNVSYINKIVADLQDFARPLTPKIEEINLKQIIRSVLSNINFPENVTVHHSISKNFPRIKVDQSYIQRILTNLSNNAIQAMPDGGKLTINAIQKGQKAIITVEDTGTGISENVKSKIFTPLITTKSKGQGFGLSVVKRFTEAMAGTVSFESEVGKGTKFKIELPL
jgi:PAS domain S-box-containing protein